MAEFKRKIEEREGGDDLLGFEGDGDDLADEAEDVFGVVGTVGVVDDAGAGVGGDAILVDDPFEGGAVRLRLLCAFEAHDLDKTRVNPEARRGWVKACTWLTILEHVFRASKTSATSAIKPYERKLVEFFQYL